MSGLNVLVCLGQKKYSKFDNEQALVLAQALAGKDGKIYKKDVFFNVLIRLPQIVLQVLPIWMTIKKTDEFDDIKDLDAIITSGSRMIRYAKHLKKYSFPEAKLIQIGNPYLASKNVDVVLRASHKHSFLRVKDAITYRGKFCNEVNNKLDNLEIDIMNIKEALKGPFIYVEIGGNHWKFQLSHSEAERFGKTISNLSVNMKMPLLINTLKHVPDSILEVIKKQLNCSYYFYKYKKNKKDPRYVFMKWSDFCITWNANIHRVCELLSIMKPTYISYNGNKSRRFTAFCDGLLKDGCIKELYDNTDELENFKPAPVQDMDKLVKQIKEKIGFNG